MVVKQPWVWAVALWAVLSVGTTASADVYDAMVAGNYEQAVVIWQEMADQGNGQAQFNLGLMYHSGMGVQQDEPTAVGWYQRAAENGYGPAQVYMVVGYEEGWFGLPKDSGKASYWREMMQGTLE